MSLHSRRTILRGGAVFLAGASATPLFAAEAPAVTMQTLTYAVRDGKELVLDLFVPAAAKAPLPVIVFLHGGGWGGGTRTTGPDFRRFFASRGFAMVSIEYRLTPQIVFPANLEDVKTSIRWIRANAKAHGLDPNRIGLWGTSAGGYLAAMAGVTPRGMFEGADNLDQSSAVTCVLDAYGPILFTTMDTETAAEKATLQDVAAGLKTAAPMVGGVVQVQSASPPPVRVVEGGVVVSRLHDVATSAESRLMGAPIQTIADKVKAASPLNFVTSHAPPFLIMHGLADDSVPHAQSVKFYEALVRAGNDATLRLVDGLPHTFFNRTNLDELAGPFRMDVTRHRRGGKETRFVDNAGVFPVAEAFFADHLKTR